MVNGTLSFHTARFCQLNFTVFGNKHMFYTETSTLTCLCYLPYAGKNLVKPVPLWQSDLKRHHLIDTEKSTDLDYAALGVHCS